MVESIRMPTRNDLFDRKDAPNPTKRVIEVIKQPKPVFRIDWEKVPDRTKRVVKPPSKPNWMSVSSRSPTMHIRSRLRPLFSAMLANMNSSGLPTTTGSFCDDPAETADRPWRHIDGQREGRTYSTDSVANSINSINGTDSNIALEPQTLDVA